MNCDRCGKPSVYHSTLIVNGVSQTRNLCRDCAVKEGVFNSEPTSLFDDMFSAFADILPFEKVENIVCPVCKTSLAEFKNHGKLGCPNCYEVFRQEVADVVKRIAPFPTHKEENDITLNTTKTKKTLSKSEEIATLREQLNLAVREERYEDASKLKKKIQALEAAND